MPRYLGTLAQLALNTIAAHPGLTQPELSKMMNRRNGTSSVYYALATLITRDLVQVKDDAGVARYYPADGDRDDGLRTAEQSRAIRAVIQLVRDYPGIRAAHITAHPPGRCTVADMTFAISHLTDSGIIVRDDKTCGFRYAGKRHDTRPPAK